MFLFRKLSELVRGPAAPPLRADLQPRLPMEAVHYAARNQPQTAPAAPYLQRYSADTLRFARDALEQDRTQGACQAERFSGAGNIPAYWHVAYSAGLPFGEMAALIDEYLDQLAYFDGVFAGIWKPARRVLDVQYQLEDALKGLAWLVGLGATRQQLERFLPFCGEPGQDALFDRAVVQLGFERPVAGRLLIESDYKQLLAVANAPTAERPRLAKLALERWTRVLAASGAPTQPGQVGYLGHWALPMALVVMLWEVDDVGLRAHPHYPSDPVAHYRGTTRR